VFETEFECFGELNKHLSPSSLPLIALLGREMIAFNRKVPAIQNIHFTIHSIPQKAYIHVLVIINFKK
jgi:hypothetical protein